LVRLFRKSREKWKARALERQQRIRALEVKVRDLEESRARWKAKAQAAEARGQKAASEASATPAGEDEEVQEGEWLPGAETRWASPARHAYPLLIMFITVHQVIVGLSSVRGSVRSLGAWEAVMRLPVPSFSSVRHWLFRLGLYLLRQPQERRDDWQVIVDLTIQWGAAKVLVVVGIPQGQLPLRREPGDDTGGWALGHRDVQLLEMEVMTHPNGERIAAILERLQARIGPIRQLVADHGSDLKRGIERFCQAHPESVYTYDITHQMAHLLKGELAGDERFEQFLHQCQYSAQRLRQTPLSPLRPPAGRAHSRWLNLKPQINWAQRVLDYAERGDFSALDPTFELAIASGNAAVGGRDTPARQAPLFRLPWQSDPECEHFPQPVQQVLDETALQRCPVPLEAAADNGRRRFQATLGWLEDFRDELAEYQLLIELIETAQHQVKHHGLTRTSAATFHAQTEALASACPRAQRFREQIIDYLHREGQAATADETLLGTSDVLESLFGKYKLYTHHAPLKEFGKWLLTLPIATVEVTMDLLKHALETVRTADVERWADEVFGRSALAQRRVLLCSPSNDTKSA
jgi:hypothetical protein